MKASEIFKSYGERFKYLTNDCWGGCTKLFEECPYYDTNVDKWYCESGDSVIFPKSVQVTEFVDLFLYGEKSIICVDDLHDEQIFSAKDMIEFVKWTNVIYRDLTHTLVIKDVDDVNELLELFKQTR